MNDSGVPRNRMDGPYDLDDAGDEALLAGSGYAVDRALADLLGDMRVAYTSRTPTVGADLGALLGFSAAATGCPSSSTAGRIRLRLAKLAAATAAVVAATGGLAVAGALPAPIQNALSDVGVGSPSGRSHADGHIAANTEPTTASATTVADTASPTTKANHGTIVSGVAHNHGVQGCAHGHDVANVASNGKSTKSNDKSNVASNGKSCPNTPSTMPAHPGPNNNTRGRNAGNGTPGNRDTSPAATGGSSSGGAAHTSSQPNANVPHGSGGGT